MLVHPKDGHLKVFCVLHAYLDDSGTHDSSPVCVVAGYFGSERHWIRFDNDWREVLNDNGLKEFHANRFRSHVKGNDVPEYRGWDAKHDDEFMARLLKTIESHRIFPVGCCVAMREWRTLP